jgi:ABC-type nitrate/sulfonate/bicarbonate transport system permease component
MRYGQAFNALCRELRQAMDRAHDRAPVLALLLLALLAGWELYCRLSGVPALIVPPPSAVLATLWSEIASGRLLPHLRITATEMTLGLALGCASGC